MSKEEHFYILSEMNRTQKIIEQFITIAAFVIGALILFKVIPFPLNLLLSILFALFFMLFVSTPFFGIPLLHLWIALLSAKIEVHEYKTTMRVLLQQTNPNKQEE